MPLLFRYPNKHAGMHGLDLRDYRKLSYKFLLANLKVNSNTRRQFSPIAQLCENAFPETLSIYDMRKLGSILRLTILKLHLNCLMNMNVLAISIFTLIYLPNFVYNCGLLF